MASSNIVDMDPDVARRLFEEGATLVLLDVPLGTELGIDCKSWQVGPRFKGVKMIPPGLHFLHYCSANSPSCGGEIGPKTGLFVTLKPKDILLARWDPKEEDLDFSPSQDEEEVSRIRANLQDLDPHLGPYPYEVIRKWVSLTDRLSEEVAKNLQPLSGRICAFSDVIPEVQLTHTKDRVEQPRNDTACQSMKEGLEKLPRMKPREGTEFRFSVIPEKKYPAGATPEQITQCSLDQSYALESVLEKNHQLQPLNLLGNNTPSIQHTLPFYIFKSDYIFCVSSQGRCSLPLCVSWLEMYTSALSTGRVSCPCCVDQRRRCESVRSSTWGSSACFTTSWERSRRTSLSTSCLRATSSPPHCR